MNDTEAQIAARSPEEQQIVRSFSINAAASTEVQNIVRAVADYSEEARRHEAAKWRLQFQDQNAARPRDLDKLGVEVKELRKLMKAFPEAGDSNTWTYDDARSAVNESKGKWENKKRFFGGKAQKVYHDVICNLDAHSGFLSIIPQSNTYVSVVTGAVKTIVKTSVNHRRTIEALTKALKDINDEAAACMAECNLIQNETIQIAVAKFYIAVLLFYADVMKFYQASSGRKIWHSLDDSFSDRFETPLENIKRLSLLVQRAAASGTGECLTSRTIPRWNYYGACWQFGEFRVVEFTQSVSAHTRIRAVFPTLTSHHGSFRIEPHSKEKVG
ncbi:hypothetical protein MMC30_005095 [Trapelia coarctata]|nr:hypothetical protein [Trapelia coarctata]